VQNDQRPPFEKGPDCLPRATLGSAMLIHPADGVAANAKYASSLLRFGASPYQVFEDEDDDEYEYD
jgi:hypothetical protein